MQYITTSKSLLLGVPCDPFEEAIKFFVSGHSLPRHIRMLARARGLTTIICCSKEDCYSGPSTLGRSLSIGRELYLQREAPWSSPPPGRRPYLGLLHRGPWLSGG